MALEILQIDTVSMVALLAVIITLIIGIFKKITMTFVLIFANVIVFVLTLFTIENYELYGFYGPVIRDLSFQPKFLSLQYSPQLYTLFSSMFIHGDFVHIFGNMFIFLFIGTPFEQRVGWKKFLIIYLGAGLCGTLAHSIMNHGEDMLLLGASGAIFGIMGAFASKYPRDEIVMPIPVLIVVIARIKVIYAVILFAVIETIMVLASVQDSTAHFAHIGGLVGGFILAALLIRKKTHTVKGKTIYFDQYKESEPLKINFSNLEKLAVNDKLKEILDRIKAETVPQVQNIWLGHFLEKAKCPTCQGSLKKSGRDISCEKCNFKIRY